MDSIWRDVRSKAVVVQKRRRLSVDGFYSHSLDVFAREYRARLDEKSGLKRCGIWKEFPKQALAFEYVDSAPAEDQLRLWAYELSDGKRRYIAASWERFRSQYATTKQKHYYELIREKHPVRAYFDLETTTSLDKAEALCDEFLRRMAIELAETPEKTALHAECERLGHFDVQPDLIFAFYAHQPIVADSAVHETLKKFDCSIALPEMVLLDATTPTKFSRHAIFDTCFVDATHLGRFVAQFMRREAKFAGIIDTSVYTRNRLFRLCGSTKRGKYAPMLPLRTQHEALPHQSLVVPLEPPGHLRSISVEHLARLPTTARKQQSGEGQRAAAAARCGQPPSPYPRLDAFVLSCRPGAYIRKWQWMQSAMGSNPAINAILFHLAGDNRYCERIQRHHKSNNVYILVDLEKRILYQKCHDPDCRKFSGFPIQLRDDLVLSTKRATQGK